MGAIWFDPNMYSWIPGTLLGVLGGCLGAAVGFLAPKGRAKRLILACHAALILTSAILLGAGIVALAEGQPYGVWYGLVLAGLIGLIVLGANVPTVRKAYQLAEERRMKAQDVHF